MRIHPLTGLFFVLFLVLYCLGNHALPVTDPVESNYALTAKEMLISGDWLSPQIYHQYWYDKPIMVYWMIALSFKVFGVTDFAARFPAALFGAGSVAFLYQIVRTISGRKLLGAWSAMILGTSLEFWILSHGIVTDMILLFMSVGIFGYAYRGLTEEKPWLIAVSYAFAGLGVLTKGPVSLVLPGILFLVFAASMKSWKMVKLLFPWQGLLAFALVGLPWYVYMYIVHGTDFINGFLGLHNVVRATQAEHPSDNHWWYYLAIFLGASMPWTGAIVYGTGFGFTRRPPFYKFLMITGWGTVLFYTCMATKYPTYSFISLIPFSVLGAWGTVKLVRRHSSRKLWWILLGPAILLWSALFVGSFYSPWGFWLLLQVVTVLGIIVLITLYIRRKRFAIPIVMGVVTLLLLGITLYEGLIPLLTLRSSVTFTEDIRNFTNAPSKSKREVYYFDGYSTSIPYYTDEEVKHIEIEAFNSKKVKKEQRSAAWNGKYIMPSIKQKEWEALVEKESMMVVVDRASVADWEMLDISKKFTKVQETKRELLFVKEK